MKRFPRPTTVPDISAMTQALRRIVLDSNAKTIEVPWREQWPERATKRVATLR